MIDWDQRFAEAHLHSEGGPPGLCIQNVNPSPSQGSRNIFKDDEKAIMAAAAKHWYVIVGSAKAKVVSFIRRVDLSA